MILNNYAIPQNIEAFKGFPDESRVWIYQADRTLTEAETKVITEYLKQFAMQWTAHNNQLRATGEVLYNRFIVLTVDETQAGASGCSIDKSVTFLKELQKQFNIDLFNRLDIAVVQKDGLKTYPLQQLKKEKELLTEDTLVFNNTLSTLSEFRKNWLLPKAQSWLK